MTEICNRDTLICHCFGIRQDVIRRAVREKHFKGIEQVTKYCRAGGGCRGCQQEIRMIIDATRREFDLDTRERAKWEDLSRRPGRSGALKRIRLVEKTLEQKIMPGLRGEGLDLELREVKGDRVSLSWKVAFPSAEVVRRWREKIESIFHSHVGKDIVVEICAK